MICEQNLGMNECRERAVDIEKLQRPGLEISQDYLLKFRHIKCRNYCTLYCMFSSAVYCKRLTALLMLQDRFLVSLMVILT